LAVTDVTPRRIGPYEIQGLLGEGGIGQVYAARDTVLGRTVAIKTLRPEMSRDRNLIDRFYVEAKSLANFNHLNITTLHALQLEGHEAFMVMELVRGNTLTDLLARVRRFSLRESLAVVAQAVAGLGYAHRMGVIHRDIKPSNLMVTDEGVLKIMDFGVARVRGSQQLTRTGEFYGTVAYASPEQIRGEPVDERADLYSLAVVLYRMLAGVVPFSANGDFALMTAQVQTPPPPLGERVANLAPKQKRR
jgi:serine/threonine-protein kinase